VGRWRDPSNQRAAPSLSFYHFTVSHSICGGAQNLHFELHFSSSIQSEQRMHPSSQSQLARSLVLTFIGVTCLSQ
jgi:hypothetical protein